VLGALILQVLGCERCSRQCLWLGLLGLLLSHLHDTWKHLLNLSCKVGACRSGQHVLLLACCSIGPAHKLLHHVGHQPQLIGCQSICPH
jgi:hypothetical protein